MQGELTNLFSHERIGLKRHHRAEGCVIFVFTRNWFLLVVLVQLAKDGAGNGLLGNIDDCLAFFIIVVIVIKGDLVDIGGEFRIILLLLAAIWQEWLT